LLTTVDRLAPGGRPGMAALRSLVKPWLGGHVLDSVAEGAFRRAICDAGLPTPVPQLEVSAGAGTPSFRLDFAWPAQMVALEVDGFRWHATPRACAQDSRRANLLAAMGWRVLRATPAELETGAAEVLAALRVELGRSA
jgi:hypothetical protein